MTQTQDLKVEYLAPALLVPYDKNSRTHSETQIAQIAASIDAFGWTNPILINEENSVIAGHGRLEAAKKLGMEAVPCIRLVGLTDAQRRALVIADNKLAENAGWDFDLLRTELSELNELNFDLGVMGFNVDELNKLMAPTGTDGLTDPDDAPPVPDFPVAQPGDLWVLGGHRLLVGDATVLNDVEKLMDGYKADLIVTDPPYNVAYEGKTKDSLTIKNDAMDNDSFYRFLLDVHINYFTIAKDGAGLYVFHADSEGLNFRKAFIESGFALKQCCIWSKQTLVMGRQDYHWQHEPILYGWKDTGSHRWYSDRKQTTLWKFDRPSRNEFHPTMKPIDLVEYPILNSSRGGDVVVDFFGGSGSTLIACEKTGRYCRTMELDPKYADVIILRWQAFTGKAAVLQDDGRTFTEVMGERAPGKLVGNDVGKADREAATKAKKKAKKAAKEDQAG